MPVELLRRPVPEDAPAAPVPAIPPGQPEDDWSHVDCCSAMRPRPQDRRLAPRPAPVYSADDLFFGE